MSENLLLKKFQSHVIKLHPTVGGIYRVAIIKTREHAKANHPKQCYPNKT